MSKDRGFPEPIGFAWFSENHSLEAKEDESMTQTGGSLVALNEYDMAQAEAINAQDCSLFS